MGDDEEWFARKRLEDEWRLNVLRRGRLTIPRFCDDVSRFGVTEGLLVEEAASSLEHDELMRRRCKRGVEPTDDQFIYSITAKGRRELAKAENGDG